MTAREWRDGRRRAVRQLREALFASNKARQAVQQFTTAFVQISGDPEASISAWEEVLEAEAFLASCERNVVAARVMIEPFITRDPVTVQVTSALSLPDPGEPND